jgi:hypothetical protein
MPQTSNLRALDATVDDADFWLLLENSYLQTELVVDNFVVVENLDVISLEASIALFRAGFGPLFSSIAM